MIFFGHLGITTAVVKCVEKTVSKSKYEDKFSIDYRLVLLGSILPDIIDKPIGAYFFRSTFHNSRIFAHSLIFSGLLIFIGMLIMLRLKKSSIFVLGVSSTIHLVLDSMWLYPGILFWPFTGWVFPVRPEGNWTESALTKLCTDPSYYLSECFGLIVIAYYFVRLIKNRQVKKFICKGILKFN